MRCTRVIVLLVCGISTAAPGCRANKPAKPADVELKEGWSRLSAQPVPHPTSVVVAEGPAPLVFQVREPTIAHVLDMTTGLEIGSAPVGRLQLVYVSEKTGAFAGKIRVVAGPLPEGHRYGISLDVGSGEKFESKIEVLPPGPPASGRIIEAPTIQPQGR